MVHLTFAQKENLKKIVITATIHRLTISETCDMIRNKLGVDMSPGYIAHLKAGLRRESEKQLDLYKRDKFAFIEGAFTKRVRELEDNQEILRHIIANNPNDPNAHWCVPECRYYFKYGRIEDSEVIQKHRELEKRYRDNNAIVEPPTTTITSSD